MKYCLIFLCLVCLWVSTTATDITMNQRLPLLKQTHVDYDLAAWDTVFVLITDSTHNLVGDTIWLDSDGEGTYYGSWWPTGVGSYVASYHCRWTDGSIMAIDEKFTVLDTTAFQAIWGDTLFQLMTFRDSTLNAITDPNKANFKYGGGEDSVQAYLVASDRALLENLAHFWGACDSCYERHFPEDGTLNKDSSYIVNPKLAGSDTLVAKVVFRHSNNMSVADTSYYYLNPWW